MNASSGLIWEGGKIDGRWVLTKNTDEGPKVMASCNSDEAVWAAMDLLTGAALRKKDHRPPDDFPGYCEA